MVLLTSPWFLGLSALSALIAVIFTWGFFRACTVHNSSSMVTICGKEARQPNRKTRFVLFLYIILTIAYIVLPPILHGYFL